jgi:CheY-like chemotaxis protein
MFWSHPNPCAKKIVAAPPPETWTSLRCWTDMCRRAYANRVNSGVSDCRGDWVSPNFTGLTQTRLAGLGDRGPAPLGMPTAATHFMASLERIRRRYDRGSAARVREREARSTPGRDGMAIAWTIGVMSVEAYGSGEAKPAIAREPRVGSDSATSGVSLLHEGRRAIGHDGSQPAAALTPLAGLRVLVVEDDTDLRELTAAILTHAGARVECADSALTGLERFIEFEPQLVLSDIAMPEVDGYALVGQIRALGATASSVPCVALTAFDTHEDRKKVLAAGFSLHLAKPIDPSALVTALAVLLDASGGARAG